MGVVMGAFLAVYALFQIPAGWLGDRWGSRRTLPLIATVWSVATASIGMATGMVSMLVSQMANGLAQAGLFPCSANSYSKWFPITQRGLPIGLTGCFQSLGLVTANLLTATLLGVTGWRMLFPMLSVLGIVWAAGFYFWFRDRPSEHSGVNEEELRVIRGGTLGPDSDDNDSPSQGDRPAATPWKQILTSSTMGLICCQQFLRAAGYAFYMTWFPTYLRETRGVELSQLGVLASLPPLAFVLAGPTGGALSDWIQSVTGNRRLSRQLPACAFMMACALFFLSAYFIEEAVPAVLVITIGSFFAALGSPPGNVVTN